MTNKILHKAKEKKNDEFYTLYEDIEKELKYYKKYLENKIIYCNADDYRYSNFVKYFKNNFKELKLKKLIATNFSTTEAYHYEYDGKKETIKSLNMFGDFRSMECLQILETVDIVITNPPFSLFREFINILEQYEKQYLVLGSNMACSYKNIFKLIKNNKMFLSKVLRLKFLNNKKAVAVFWYTNIKKYNFKKIKLTETYDKNKYKKYDNYDAINVNKTKDIPKDYDGLMGVPISFIYKWNKKQFKLIDSIRPVINGKYFFKRFIIKNIEEKQ